jgi:hypothetical protein
MFSPSRRVGMFYLAFFRRLAVRNRLALCWCGFLSFIEQVTASHQLNFGCIGVKTITSIKMILFDIEKPYSPQLPKP